ncbi:hypothetical protein [uncultured Nostoc sp.]|uniref:hypothetical protein n=1 Tax=uncultured Nostoc sp. TaxID=340711 RepID=UPI0035CAF0D6
MKILDHKDAINHRQDEELIIVETAIYHVSCLNRTVLGAGGQGGQGSNISPKSPQSD